MNNFTMDLYQGLYKQMMASTFNDVGDLGNIELCRSIDIATYTVVQLNVTNLPLDIRIGMCFPKECTQPILNAAGKKVSDTISGLALSLGEALNIDLITKFQVGVQLTFKQPDYWYQTQQDENTVSASAMGAVILFFIGIAGAATVASLYKPKKSIKDDLPTVNKKAGIEAIMAQEEARVRESTKPFTFKFRGAQTAQYQNLDSVGNPVDSNDGEEDGQGENSIFDNRVSSDNGSVKDNKNFFLELFDCFSIPRNLYSLNNTKRSVEDNQELDVIEGIKVLTM